MFPPPPPKKNPELGTHQGLGYTRGHADGGQHARGEEQAGVRWDAGGGTQAAGTAEPSCGQQPCRELHKLPIWQPNPAGEGHHGPVPAAIPVSLCYPGLLPQPSCLGRGGMGDPLWGNKWGKAMVPPSLALPGGAVRLEGRRCLCPWVCPGSRALGRTGFPRGRLVLTVSV